MITKFETLTYNGFTFPVESKLEVDFPPKYDQADRAVVGVHHSLKVTVTLKTDALVGQSVNGVGLVGVNETDLPVIKAALTQAGQALVLTGTGFGDLSVNGNAEKQDSAWGPKPRHCSFLPLGTTACVLRWHCDVQLPTCLDATFAGAQRLMAYNYTIGVMVDEQGYATRTVSGYYEVPMSRGVGGGNTVFSSALSLWRSGVTTPPVPEGFRRLSNEATDSEDRRRVNFRVVDAETNDVILPPNVVECRASHSVQSMNRAPGTRMLASLRASYTLRKGVRKQDAFTYFLLLLWQKWKAQTEAAQGGGVERGTILPLSLTMEDPDIYGRTAGNFSMTWAYWNGSRPAGGDVKQFDLNSAMANVVPNSALWNPGVKGNGTVVQSPLGNGWNQWRSSMDGVFGSGTPRFNYSIGDDVILDLCGDGVAPLTKGSFFRITGYNSPASANVRVKPGTYVRYFTKFQVTWRRGSVIPPAVGGAANALVSSLFWWFGGNAQNPLAGTIQDLSSSTAVGVFFYDIVQAAVPPVKPVLSRVGNSPAVFAKDGRCENYLHSVLFGIPCFGLRGADAYVLRDVPPDFPDFPPNYFLTGDNTVYSNGSPNEINGVAL